MGYVALRVLQHIFKIWTKSGQLEGEMDAQGDVKGLKGSKT